KLANAIAQLSRPTATCLVADGKHTAGETAQLLLRLLAAGNIAVELKVSQGGSRIIAPKRPPARDCNANTLPGSLFEFGVPAPFFSKNIVNLRQWPGQFSLQ